MHASTRTAGRATAWLVTGFAATLMAIEPVAEACTRVLWTSPDGQAFVGRTQDWTEKANSSFRVYPRGIERAGSVAENPHKWTSKYGSLVLSIYDMGTHEGVNEKGLSAHVLYLAGEADFGKRDPKLQGIGIGQWTQYFLDNYATVAEAVEAQKRFTFQIEPLILPNGYPALVHLSLSDKSGDSAVIEYIAGRAKVYHDKRFNVMTNEPTYDKQIQNLKQYRSFGGDKPLPGERTPSDRFVRAAYYANGLPKPANRAEGAAYMFSVIRNVSVPFGTGDPEKPNVASTIFRTVIDLTGGRYYFESTYAPNVVWVDYSKLDFGKGTGERELQVEKSIFSLNGDVTGQLRPAKPFVFAANKP
ncbi:MAG: linear amide C-N hydrolase [Steroidobacteraceae bacterium]|jgi:choloylglycine hydrolase|nr:linear amide C-N hydrolase [Steroidobacteraceae bacterium]